MQFKMFENHLLLTQIRLGTWKLFQCKKSKQVKSHQVLVCLFLSLLDGICSVYGDPHYTTFDNRNHHYMGACSYTLTELCNASSGLPYFTVATQNEHRGSNKKVSYVKAVLVTVTGVSVVLGKGRTVQVCPEGDDFFFMASEYVKEVCFFILAALSN